MAFQIPERLINFKVYDSNSKELIGLSDVELPKFDAMTESIAGVGIAGELESVVLGHFKSMQVVLKLLTPTDQAIKLLAPVVQAFDLRGSIQLQDPSAGALLTKPLRVSLRGQVKTFGLGKFEPGKKMESDVTVECQAISVFYDGVSLIELDKLNMIFKVNGFDYLRSARQDMGGV